MFVWFKKNNNRKSHFRTSKDGTWIEKPKCSHLGDPSGSFQHTLWPRRRVSEAAILLSRAFAFVFSCYKVIIALSLRLSSGAFQHTVHTSIIAAKIVSLKFFCEPQYFGRTWGSLEQKQQNQSVHYKMQTVGQVHNADLVENADCRPGTKCRLRIYTVFYSDTW